MPVISKPDVMAPHLPLGCMAEWGPPVCICARRKEKVTGIWHGNARHGPVSYAKRQEEDRGNGAHQSKEIPLPYSEGSGGGGQGSDRLGPLQ